MTNGNPYSPLPPKSAWRKRCPPAEMDAMYVSDLGSSGKFRTSVFHALSAGKTGQPLSVGPFAGGVAAFVVAVVAGFGVTVARGAAACGVVVVDSVDDG